MFRFIVDPNGEFKVEANRKLDHLRITMIDSDSIVWTKIVPLEVQCFVWRVKLGRILIMIVTT